MPTTRESLEAALAADPDNRTLHSAYADLLIEEGDPRGEFIRLKLTSDDESLPDPERYRFADREVQLIERHERDWLGPLFDFVHAVDLFNPINDQATDPIQVGWKYGWLHDVRIRCLDVRLFDALRRCPVNRLIDSITIVHPVLPDEPATMRTCFQFLNDVPFRSLILEGFESLGDRIVRILNRYLKRSRMFHLVLDGCGITDDGADWLAHSRIAADLKSLRMPRNYLSPIGVAALAEVGFRVAERRTGPDWGG